MTLDQPYSDESNPDKHQRSVLVTGGAGFIASNLIKFLIKKKFIKKILFMLGKLV